MDGDDLPKVNITASLIQPAGKNGPSYLVYQNYRAIMRWNRSHFYALAVCRLADRLAIKGT
jgi:membrane-bound lytic murein transglycosylase B